MNKVLVSDRKLREIFSDVYVSGRFFGYTVSVGKVKSLADVKEENLRSGSCRGHSWTFDGETNHVCVIDDNQQRSRPERGGYRTIRLDRLVSVRTRGTEYISDNNIFSSFKK